MLASFFLNLVEDFLRNLSGRLGFTLRGWYYGRRLNGCGRKLRVDTGVYFSNPGSIRLGENVWIDKNSHFIAGSPAIEDDKIKYLSQAGNGIEKGRIVIGNNAHIGIGTIIQGHGGVRIADCFTSSAGCKIYSFSNDPYRCKAGTHSESAEIYYVLTPVDIRNNVWLGINVTVIGNTIHEDSFIQPHAVVTSDIEADSVAAGNPARRVRSRFEKMNL